MPIYEYRCSGCGHQEEFLQKVTEPLHSQCPACGKPTFEKLLSAAGFQLKGSGWYATDFKSRPAEKKTDAKPETKADAKPGTKADAKPDTKAEPKPETTKQETKAQTKPTTPATTD